MTIIGLYYSFLDVFKEMAYLGHMNLGDKITVQGIEVYCIIGTHEDERVNRQQILFDVTYPCETSNIVSTDELNSVVDYEDLTNSLVKYAEESRFQLVETLVNKLASFLIEKYNLDWVKLRLDKPKALKNAKNVSIEIVRER